MKKMVVILILVIGGVFFADCVSQRMPLDVSPNEAISINTPIPEKYQCFAEGYTNDRRLDGTWVQTFSDGQYQFIFYADTWRILWNNEPRYSGIFLIKDNKIKCSIAGAIVNGDKVFDMEYELQESRLIIEMKREQKWLDGAWYKKDTTPQPPNENPLVGTWKGLFNDKVLFYQFNSDGTFVLYTCDPKNGNLDDTGTLGINNNGTYDLNSLQYEYLLNFGFGSMKAKGNFRIEGNSLIVNEKIFLDKI